MQNGGGRFRIEALARHDQHLGRTGLGTCLAGGRVYYVQCANGQPRPQSRGRPDLLLFSGSLDPKSGHAITDHGLIVDQAGRHPWRTEAMSADGKGKVFMTGDWRLNPGETGLTRYAFRGGRDTWQTFGVEGAPRGQFFAVADLAAPPAPASTAPQTPSK